MPARTDQIPSRPSRFAAAVPAALALLLAFDLWSFLGPGLPVYFDAHSHLARSWFASEAFAGLEFPSWSNAWYAGYPAFEFTSPLYYWITGALARITGDVSTAAKLALWLGQLVMLLGFFRLLRELGQTPLVAALGTVLLLRSPVVRWVLGMVGSYPSLVVLATLPFLLALARRHAAAKASTLSLFLGQSLGLGLMLAGHLTNTLAQLPAILAFEATLLAGSAAPRRERARAAAAVALSLAAGAALASFVFGPLLLDVERVSLALVFADPPAPRLELHPLLVLAGLAPFSFDYNLVYDHGTPLVGVALLAGLVSLLPRARALRPAAAGLAVSLVAIPLLGDRAALSASFLLFALVSSAVGAVASLAGRLHRAAPTAVAGACLLAAWLWPGVETRGGVPNYVRPRLLEVYHRIPDSPTRSRTFDITPTSLALDGFYGWSSASPVWSGRGIPFGGFPQGAFLDSQVLMALASRWVTDRDAQSTWSELALDAFYLAHVQFLIDRAERGPPAREPAPGSEVEWLAPELSRLRWASPAVFAERLALLTPEPGAERGAGTSSPLHAALQRQWRLDPAGERKFRDSALRPLARLAGGQQDWRLFAGVVSAMEIDRRRATARQLFATRELPPPAGAGSSSAADAAASFEVLSHSETLTSARVATRSRRPGFVRLSYSHAPGLRITLDGSPVPAVPDALGGALIVALPPGVHAVEIRAPDASPRAAWALACALAALALGAAQLREITRARPGRGGAGPP